MAWLMTIFLHASWYSSGWLLSSSTVMTCRFAASVMAADSLLDDRFAVEGFEVGGELSEPLGHLSNIQSLQLAMGLPDRVST